MNIKNIRTILAKLGIFRFGAFKWKGSGKDRPIEAIDSGAYNSEIDYVNKEDVTKIKEKFFKKK